MGIKFKIVEKTNPQKPNEEKMYYAQAVSFGTKENEDLANNMANICSMSKIDLTTSLHALSTVIKHELQQGHSVKIKGLGTFYTSIKSDGTPNPRKANKSLIKEVSAGFRPSSELKTALASAEFDKVNRD